MLAPQGVFQRRFLAVLPQEGCDSIIRADAEQVASHWGTGTAHYPQHPPPCVDCRDTQDEHALLNESGWLTNEEERQKLLQEIDEKKLVCNQVGVYCSAKEACLVGILCRHHRAMWLREWTPPADVKEARARASVVVDNPAKRPCTDQRAGQSSSTAVDLEGEEDESMAPGAMDQPEVADWELDVFLRAIHAVTHKVLL